MAINTLKHIDEIGMFALDHIENGEARRTKIDEGSGYIVVDHDQHEIRFTIQDGPIKGFGVNGCQIDQVIEAAKIMLEGLNENFSCRENSIAITKLDEALMWLEKRKKDRINRGVEGTLQA